MSPEEFLRLAGQGYKRIPVTREVSADFDTPLAIYAKLADGPYSYLFESVLGGERWGRYSIIGLPCKETIKVSGHSIRHRLANGNEEQHKSRDPLDWIEQFRHSLKVAPTDAGLRFCGGLVGYFGYDTVRYIEPRLAEADKPDEIGAPDILLMVSSQLAVFDNLRGSLTLIVHADGEDSNGFQSAEKMLDQFEDQLRAPVIRPKSDHAALSLAEADFSSGFTEAGFKEAVCKARQYIIDGDIMQVVLSQRLSAAFSAPPLNLYRALRRINPSPYMYFLELEEFQIVGSSPEILVRMENNQVTVRPIAGTRRRGHTPEEDQAFENELLADPKELAEHLMLIDLGRNDIGRVSQTGSVKLTEKMCIERYSHVMHITSNVTGDLRSDAGPIDALRATFPAGTVSGAPKVRAMEIIDELEPIKRGVYAGAVGYLSWDGNMDTAIAIRTAVVKDRQVHIQAGAGIVYDSQPDLEWKETMNKARALFKAAEMAEQGFD